MRGVRPRSSFTSERQMLRPTGTVYRVRAVSLTAPLLRPCCVCAGGQHAAAQRACAGHERTVQVRCLQCMSMAAWACTRQIECAACASPCCAAHLPVIWCGQASEHGLRTCFGADLSGGSHMARIHNHCWPDREAIGDVRAVMPLERCVSLQKLSTAAPGGRDAAAALGSLGCLRALLGMKVPLETHAVTLRRAAGLCAHSPGPATCAGTSTAAPRTG